LVLVHFVGRNHLADRFRWFVECRIVRIDDHLRHQRRHDRGEAGVVKGVAQALLEHVTHASLGVGHADVERQIGQSATFDA
jgi:hypothetical protein